MEKLLGFALVSALIAIGYTIYRYFWVKKQDPGDEGMQEIANYIREGAMAFLQREYRSLSIFVVVVAIILAIINKGALRLVSVSFIVGALLSALAGFIGMKAATLSNVRTTNQAKKGLVPALKIAFAGGSIMGMGVVGLGVIGLSTLMFIYTRIFGSSVDVLSGIVLPVVSGFSLGASSIALFARVGGGIYTKAADVGADLVGKVEKGIPEDDPRNPAVIADNVGDNVGDVAGMGADLFESYVGSIVGSMILGAITGFMEYVIFPLFLAGLGILSSLIGTFFVRTDENGDPQKALNKGSFIAGGLILILAFLSSKYYLPPLFKTGNVQYTALGVFFATIAGLAGGILIGLLTEYYTSESKKPAQSIAKDSMTGVATNIISGIGVGMQSTALPIVVLGTVIVIAFNMAGLYGISIAALGMLSTTGIQLAVDAYGPIADNAGGIAEMTHQKPEVRKRTDKLDAVGNTTAAIGKGFAIGSAALTALALFSAFRTSAGLSSIDINNPYVVVGLFIGAMLPYLFSSFAIKSVGKAAFQMINEVRRQFKEIPGLLEGTGKADYAKCVDISTSAALKEMILPGLLAVLFPLIGFLNKELLGGLLAGVTASGVLLAIFMANSGGAWDNAKKYIEGGHHGGKGSEAHKAAVVGDTVGDPFKDTAGPSLNILIKLMSVVALVIAPLLK
jgi:K(+)-stimulated pyrophosphate-energized sodium pump